MDFEESPEVVRERRERDRRWAEIDAFCRPARMVVCATCGNKRCPGVNGHPCSNSNEPGQPGSNYPPTE